MLYIIQIGDAITQIILICVVFVIQNPMVSKIIPIIGSILKKLLNVIIPATIKTTINKYIIILLLAHFEVSFMLNIKFGYLNHLISFEHIYIYYISTI
jgi:hypothetical protein